MSVKRIKSGIPKVDELNNLIEEIEQLKIKLDSKRKPFRDCTLEQRASKASLNVLQPCRMTCAHILKAHNTRIHDVVWAPNDTRLLSVGAENCIVFWDVQTGFIDNLVDASLQQPLTADVTQDCNTMYCGGLCANVVAYNTVKSDDPTGYTEYTPAATIDHDSRVVRIKYLKATNELVTCADTDGIQIFDATSHKRKNKFTGHLQTTTSIHLIEGSGLFLSGGTDGVVRLWDARSKSVSVINFHGHMSDITCLDVFPNKQTFISGSDDTFCILYDIRHDKAISRYSDPIVNEDYNQGQDQVVKPAVATVNSVQITPSGRMFITGCGDSVMYYFDVFNSEQSVHQREETGPVRRLSFSHENNGLASVLWDAKNRLRVFVPS